MLSADERQTEVTQSSSPLDEFHGWLAEVVARQASDLHVKAGTPSKIRETGLYMSAVAQQIEDVDEAIEIYARRSVEQGISRLGSRDVPPPRTSSPLSSHGVRALRPGPA